MVGMLQACVWALSQTFFPPLPLSLSISSEKKGVHFLPRHFPAARRRHRKIQEKGISLLSPSPHLRILPSSSFRVSSSCHLSHCLSVCLSRTTHQFYPAITPLPQKQPPPAGKMVQKIYVTYNDVRPPI